MKRAWEQSPLCPGKRVELWTNNQIRCRSAEGRTKDHRPLRTPRNFPEDRIQVDQTVRGSRTSRIGKSWAATAELCSRDAGRDCQTDAGITVQTSNLGAGKLQAKLEQTRSDTKSPAVSTINTILRRAGLVQTRERKPSLTHPCRHWERSRHPISYGAWNFVGILSCSSRASLAPKPLL
jgi:hypothetical protein